MGSMWRRMFVATVVIGAVSFGGLRAPLSARQAQDQKPPDPKKAQEDQKQKPKPQEDPKQKPQPGQRGRQAPPAKPEPPARPEPAARPRPAEPRPAEPQRQPQRPPPQAQPRPLPAPQPPPREPRHLPPAQQQVRIERQQQQLTQYGAQLDQQQRLAPQLAIRLQQQNRSAQYAFQLQYVAGLQTQVLQLRNSRTYNYGGDPYFYTPASYRYSRGGRSYETNQFGADVLRQAVNAGYGQGVWAGRADREDHWGFNYRDSYAYRDANFGFGGFYVERDEYNYYFRQGFQRGYSDGYYSRHRYGTSTSGRAVVLSPVLSLIINFRPIR